MICRRCGVPLVVDLIGVPKCFACQHREHAEIDRLVAGLRAEADRTHQRLAAIAVAQASKGKAA